MARRVTFNVHDAKRAANNRGKQFNFQLGLRSRLFTLGALNKFRSNKQQPQSIHSPFDNVHITIPLVASESARGTNLSEG